MSTMVERVARALHEKPGTGYGWDDATDAERRHAREYARAAIEAMREPTDAMVDSCGNGECAKWALGAWANFIDAALQEQEQGR